MVCRVESFRDDKGIRVLQFLKLSNPFVIPGRIYDFPKLKKWMCELCTFSQIRSHIMLVVAFGWCTPGLKDHLLFKCGQLNIALLYYYRMIILH